MHRQLLEMSHGHFIQTHLLTTSLHSSSGFENIWSFCSFLTEGDVSKTVLFLSMTLSLQ